MRHGTTSVPAPKGSDSTTLIGLWHCPDMVLGCSIVGVGVPGKGPLERCIKCEKRACQGPQLQTFELPHVENGLEHAGGDSGMRGGTCAHHCFAVKHHK